MLRSGLDEAAINKLIARYWRVRVVELTSSTQSDLALKVRNKSAQIGEVLVANYQSAGRGRLDRSFEAAPSTALLFSLYIAPQRSRDNWGWIPLIAGYSVAKTLQAFGAQVKWPNDILIKDKKVSGLIAEVVGDGVVVGIGLNVGMEENQLPVKNATSLLLEGATDLTRADILIKILEEFEKLFCTWDQGDDEIQRLYAQLSATLGKEIRVEYPNGKSQVGIASSISESGALVLDDGTHVQAADIVHLR